MSDGQDRTRTVHVIIEGRVQGVYYRAWTREQATVLGLAGWVRNRREGSVEAVFSGAVADVEEMLARCREGPADALVEAVRIVGEGGAAPDGFEIAPSA